MTTRRDPEMATIYSGWMVAKSLRKLKERAVEYKGGKCIKCGYDKCLTSMVFHHRNPEEKEIGISGKFINWEVLRCELDKCDLLCANCHGEVHEEINISKINDREIYIRNKIPKRGPSTIVEINCETCGKPFHIYRSQRKDGRFCSVSCRGKSHRIAWPSDDEMRQMANTMSKAEIAEKFSCDIRTVQRKLKGV